MDAIYEFTIRWFVYESDANHIKKMLDYELSIDSFDRPIEIEQLVSDENYR